MKALVQRVKGRTQILCREGEKVLREGSFSGPGFVVLLGWLQSDTSESLVAAEEWLRTRVEGLRVFPDAQGRMNLSLADYLKEPSRTEKGEGGILWVPQFTLAATLESGFRPSFIKALAPEAAKARFQQWQQRLELAQSPYKNDFGVFGADMELSFCNWGPVTIPLEK